MTLVADPAAVFESDAHRRVLAHLPQPTDEYGYTVDALAYRMAGDYSLVHANVPDGQTAPGPLDVLTHILGEAVQNGLVERSPSGAHRLTQAGFDKLSIPPAVPGVAGPAAIDSHHANAGAAAVWDNAPAEATDQPDEVTA